MDFNLQQFLSEMRQEQRDDHKELSTKVEDGFSDVKLAMSNHEIQDTIRFASIDKRLDSVENTRRSIRWLAGTVIVAAIGVAFELLTNHLGK